MDVMTHSQQNSILNKNLKGITIAIILTIVTGTAITTWRVNDTYRNILEAIKDNSTADNVRDMQISELRVRLEKLEIEVNQLKTKK